MTSPIRTQIDTAKHEVAATWPLAPGVEPSGMAIDEAHHRLFIGCDNKLMLMVDSETGKVVGSVPIGEGVDGDGFDPGTQMAFASNNDGTLTVVHEDGPGHFSVVQNVQTMPGAKTMGVDPRTHKVYTASAKFGPAPKDSTAANPRRRPPVLPGTFAVIVLGQ